MTTIRASQGQVEKWKRGWIYRQNRAGNCLDYIAEQAVAFALEAAAKLLDEKVKRLRDRGDNRGALVTENNAITLRAAIPTKGEGHEGDKDVTKADKALLRKMAREGRSVEYIRRRVDCAESTIKRYLQVLAPMKPLPIRDIPNGVGPAKVAKSAPERAKRCECDFNSVCPYCNDAAIAAAKQQEQKS